MCRLIVCFYGLHWCFACCDIRMIFPRVNLVHVYGFVIHRAEGWGLLPLKSNLCTCNSLIVSIAYYPMVSVEL